MTKLIRSCALILVTLPVLAACSKGGSLTLEHPLQTGGPSTGKPFATMTLGGSSLVIEQGKTKTTGYHGWISMNAVSARKLDGGGNTILMDKSPLAQ